MHGAITLGDLVGKLTMLEISCSRCNRHGRLRLDRLIEQHGADAGLPALRHTLAGECQRNGSASVYNRCAASYPQLPALFMAGRPT